MRWPLKVSAEYRKSNTGSGFILRSHDHVFGDVDNGGPASDGVTDAKRPREFELAGGPHPPRKRHRGKKTTAFGVTIWPDLRLAIEGQKIQPVPQRGQGSAGCWPRRGPVECGREGSIRCRGDDVTLPFGLADPWPQVGATCRARFTFRARAGVHG